MSPQDTICRFSSTKYFHTCLGDPQTDSTAFKVWELYSASFPEYLKAQYEDAALASIEFAEDRMLDALYDETDFVNFMILFTQMSAYSDESSLINSGSNRFRLFKEKDLIYEVIVKLEEQGMLRIDGNPWERIYQGNLNNLSNRDFFEMLECVRLDYFLALSVESGLDFDQRLNSAISGLYQMLLSWFWRRGNCSRSLNLFNTSLRTLGYEPIPHGVVDIVAMGTTLEEFTQYVRYLVLSEER